MYYIDVFNGDADGICALVQLRLAQPRDSRLVTGTKRNINLLKQVDNGADSYITVLDIAFSKNANDVQRLLQQGAIINYIDHHQTGDVISHRNLNIDIDLASDVCTSLIVDKQLQEKYRAWAITAAFGDNLFARAMQLGSASGLSQQQLTALRILGIYINYNSYGDDLTDLFFEPAQLYQKLVLFETPFEFLQQDKATFQTLEQGYCNDMVMAKQSPIVHQTAYSKVIELPNDRWARRVSGAFANQLTNDDPDKAHAIVIRKTDGDYLVSVRAPLNRKTGADKLASQFPSGGGRKAAAGINALPTEMLNSFVDAFAKQFQI